ncbi:tetratricopeptide repeat protein [Streptomyces hoynatensis]|uniref:Tetratricopeptide repeat protein n=1 Tax=Streptomyces hoynatensis TaxID=1141874 RepID=A0A3A9Z0R3_9ACTN|nr:hypothetical protein [Streptomyces hoynatensis]RKN41629.1 hypothetical protein D7294_14135 [Streptomyces hoynatensis]
MLGRRRLALGGLGVTVLLVALLTSVAPAVWCECLVLLWWVAAVLHGWYLAGGRLRRTRREAAPAGAPDASGDPLPEAGAPTARGGRVGRQRLFALGVAAPVLVAFAALRIDASQIEGDAAEAHRAGDCSRALSLLDGLWFGHRVADAPLAERADDGVAACELLLEARRQAETDRLRAARTLETYETRPGALWEGARDLRADLFLAQAAEELDTALTGDTEALATGFDQLTTVLGEFPEQEDEVEGVMEGFLDELPVEDDCRTKTITDWLGQRPAGGNVLDRAAEAVPRLAPAALLGCGDDLMAEDDWAEARDRYRQLLDEYPGHELAGRAEEGVEQAGLAIELDRVRELLRTDYTDEQPAYCDDPAPYHGAAPYRGHGPHPALLFGNEERAGALPSSWLADDAAEAVLVICLGEETMGDAVETCPYESDLGVYGYQDVTFHKREIPARVYEVRTGEPVSQGSIQIGGASCPDVLEYETYLDLDLTIPPSDVYVTSSDADVRAAFEPLINP